MNKIDFSKYVDHIFCIHYLPNNRLENISKQFDYIGIDIHNNNLFSFEYGIENQLFVDQIKDYCNKYNKLFEGAFDYQRYMFEVGLNIYHVLKIAQYKKYKRIIIFEDDIKFLKDLDYIKNALDYIFEQDFDYVHCDPNYTRMYRGIEDYLFSYNLISKPDNPYFYKLKYAYKQTCIYDAGFMILSSNAIDLIISLFEKSQITTGLDMIYNPIWVNDISNLKIYGAIKPLAIQDKIINKDKDYLNSVNVHLNIEEYNI